MDFMSKHSGMYFNREGEAIGLWEWVRLCELPGYRRVATTVLEDGRWVSTVWFGLDHGFGGPPLIFETMVFSAETHEAMGRQVHESLDCYRYATEIQALAGHESVVAELRGTVTISELLGD